MVNNVFMKKSSDAKNKNKLSLKNISWHDAHDGSLLFELIKVNGRFDEIIIVRLRSLIIVSLVVIALMHIYYL